MSWFECPPRQNQNRILHSYIYINIERKTGFEAQGFISDSGSLNQLSAPVLLEELNLTTLWRKRGRAPPGEPRSRGGRRESAAAGWQGQEVAGEGPERRDSTRTRGYARKDA